MSRRVCGALLTAAAFAGCSASGGAGGVAGAPDPGGSERGSLARAARQKLFGFSDSAFSAPAAFNPARLTAPETAAAAKGAGASSQRIVVQWRLAEPAPGQFNHAYLGGLRRLADAFGGRVLVTLAFAPKWANPRVAASCPPAGDCLLPPSPAMLGRWRDFVRRTVRAFPRAAVEIWNEPNVSRFWFPAIDPAAYERLVATTWRVVRSERAAGRWRGRVIAGALATVPDAGTRSMLPWRFLAALYRDGLRGSYDAISWHPYPYQESSAVLPLGAGAAFARDWREMRAVVGREDPRARFWVTETGVTTTGPGTAVTAAVQARRLTALVRRLATMPDVDAVYVHTLFEWAIYGPGDRERGFGVIAAPAPGQRAAKPAYCALARAAGRPPPRLCRRTLE